VSSHCSSKGRNRVKAAEPASASDSTGASDATLAPSANRTLAEPANPSLASPAKKPRGRPSKTAAAAAAQSASVATATAPSAEAGTETAALQASPKGKAVKPKGRKKKAEPVKELESAELPKGPAFAFEIDHVLALGSRCGLPMDKATRDEMSVQHHKEIKWKQQQVQSALLDSPKAPESSSTIARKQSVALDNIAQTGSAHVAFSGAPNPSRDNIMISAAQQEAWLSASPPVPDAELPLRDRLHKIQHLLLQAGLSPAQALLAASPASHSKAAASAPDASSSLTAASVVDAAAGVGKQQQQDDTIDLSDADPFRTGLTHGAGSSTAAAGSLSVSTPMWSHGLTYDEMICLVGPSPVPLHQRLDDSKVPDSPSLPSDFQPLPVDTPHSPPAAPSLLPQREQSPVQSHKSVELVSSSSPQKQSSSQQPASPTAHFGHGGFRTTEGDKALLDMQQDALSASVHTMDESELSHSMHGSASCQPSAASIGSIPQTKKRSR